MIKIRIPAPHPRLKLGVAALMMLGTACSLPNPLVAMDQLTSNVIFGNPKPSHKAQPSPRTIVYEQPVSLPADFGFNTISIPPLSPIPDASPATQFTCEAPPVGTAGQGIAGTPDSPPTAGYYRWEEVYNADTGTSQSFPIHDIVNVVKYPDTQSAVLGGPTIHHFTFDDVMPADTNELFGALPSPGGHLVLSFSVNSYSDANFEATNNISQQANPGQDNNVDPTGGLMLYRIQVQNPSGAVIDSWDPDKTLTTSSAASPKPSPSPGSGPMPTGALLFTLPDANGTSQSNTVTDSNATGTWTISIKSTYTAKHEAIPACGEVYEAWKADAAVTIARTDPRNTQNSPKSTLTQNIEFWVAPQFGSFVVQWICPDPTVAPQSCQTLDGTQNLSNKLAKTEPTPF